MQLLLSQITCIASVVKYIVKRRKHSVPTVFHLFRRFSSFDEENARFCCENIAANVEHTLEWEREMVIKRQQEVIKINNYIVCICNMMRINGKHILFLWENDKSNMKQKDVYIRVRHFATEMCFIHTLLLYSTAFYSLYLVLA